MVRASITSVELRRSDLRRPFPRRFVQRLTSQRVLTVTRRAKYLLASLSSGETLLMHLGMSGSFRTERDAVVRPVTKTPDSDSPHDHVVFHMSTGRRVIFNDPRRFGLMDLVRTQQLNSHPALEGLGPEPLSDDFTAEALARACRGKTTSLKAALLDQRIVAGLGNIYASESLHVAGLSPRRRASTLATASGAPRDAAFRLTAAIKDVLNRAIARQLDVRYRDAPFLVYDRETEPCPRSNCTGTVRRRVQGGRSTYYCPVCQR